MAGSAVVAAALLAAGVQAPIEEFEVPTRTAVEAATALDCPLGAIANSLVFVADGAPLLILASGAHRVEVTHLAATLAVGELRAANAEEVRGATGQSIGGVAPLGHPLPLRTLIDVDLRAYNPIWAAGGTAHSIFRTSFEELARITSAEEVSVAIASRGA